MSPIYLQIFERIFKNGLLNNLTEKEAALAAGCQPRPGCKYLEYLTMVPPREPGRDM